MSGHVRNIQQSLQDRDTTKQCPDIVCFINGQNYLNNPFLGEGAGISVPFNDYVSSFQVSYDVEALIPSATITLIVPNFADYQFRTPGGNNLLRTMDEIRVYGKGSYLSSSGNTVYRQIFRGFVTSINYNIDGKHTIISLSCSGAMGLLERMQVDMVPSAMSNPAQEVTSQSTTNWNMGPLDQIAWVFLYGSMLDGFDQMTSVPQAPFDPSQPLYRTVEDNFVSKWQPLLYDLARDVHIFGKPNVSNVLADSQHCIRDSAAATAADSLVHSGWNLRRADLRRVGVLRQQHRGNGCRAAGKSHRSRWKPAHRRISTPRKRGAGLQRLCQPALDQPALLPRRTRHGDAWNDAAGRE